MTERSPMAGGLFIALGAILGVYFGTRAGETSAGLVIGLATGGLIALLVWFIDRRRDVD